MKNLLFCLLITALFSCSRDDAAVAPSSNQMLLLKLDYTTFEFQGGIELNLMDDPTSFDSIPLAVDYNPPGDFGDIAVYYDPTDEKVFAGTVIWMGSGSQTYPSQFAAPNGFGRTANALPFPGEADFQHVFPEYPAPVTTEVLEDIWAEIDDLSIVSQYHQDNKKIGIMLYTPSVGVGDPNEWYWVVMMHRNTTF
jgi:hypothetical protein